MGPRGMTAGAAVGAALGIVSGGVSIGLIKLSGVTMEETRYWQYKWKTERIEAYKEGFDKNMKGTPYYKSDPMQEFHDAKIVDSKIELNQLADEAPETEEEKKVNKDVKKIEDVKK